jgi:hypothetical protein
MKDRESYQTLGASQANGFFRNTENLIMKIYYKQIFVCHYEGNPIHSLDWSARNFFAHACPLLDAELLFSHLLIAVTSE